MKGRRVVDRAGFLTLVLPMVATVASPGGPPGQRFEPSDGGFQDRFGWSVSIDGKTAAVGSIQSDSETEIESGAVYLFERQPGGGGWQEVTKLTSPDPDTSDDFGVSVSLQGGTLAVGAVGDDDDGINGGAVYIFERQGRRGGEWELTAKILSGDGRGDFGCDVDLDGVLLAVGACAIAGVEARAYLFQRRPGAPSSWERKRVFLAPGAGAFYGRQVAVSGNTVSISASLSNQVVTQGGAIYVHERDAGGVENWGLTVRLTPDVPAFSGVGSSLDLDGDRMLAGGPGFAGIALIFERQGDDQWLEVARLEHPDPGDSDAAFGSAVALSGDRALIGAPSTDVGFFGGGAAYMFERNRGGAGAWGQTRRFTSTDKDQFENFGAAVGLWRGTSVIADPVDDVSTTQVGSVHIF